MKMEITPLNLTHLEARLDTLESMYATIHSKIISHELLIAKGYDELMEKLNDHDALLQAIEKDLNRLQAFYNEESNNFRLVNKKSDIRHIVLELLKSPVNHPDNYAVEASKHDIIKCAFDQAIFLYNKIESMEID